MERKNLLGFAIGPVIGGVMSLITLPIAAWIFPSEMIGKLSMLQVVIGLVLVICCLGLDQAYGREYEESKDRANLFLNAIVPGFVLIVVASVLFLVAAPKLISKLLFDIDSFELSWIVAVCLLIAHVSRFISLILRMQNRGLEYSISQIANSIILLLIFIGYAIFTNARYFWMLLLAQAIANVSVLFFVGWRTQRDWRSALRKKINIKQIQILLSFGFPLIFAGLASWGLFALARIFLRSMSNYEELAIYSIAASIASGVTVIAGIFNTIWTPIVYRWVAEGIDVVARVELIALRGAILIAMLMCFLGGTSWILSYVLPPAYARVPYLVIGCMIAPALYTLSEITGIGLAIKRRTIFSLVASGIAVSANVGLCVLLVPRFGALGATISTAVSFWLFFVLRTEISGLLWYRLRAGIIHIYALLCVIWGLVYGAYGHLWPRFVMLGSFLIFCTLIYLNRIMLVELYKLGIKRA